MAEKVNWSYAAQVVGGPMLAGSGAMEVEAYVKLSVVVPATGSLDVEVLPGGGGSVQLLVVSPASPSTDLTYKIGSETVALDGPHVLIGGGAVGLLAATVGTLEFSNGGAEDAEISILAGRDATS